MFVLESSFKDHILITKIEIVIKFYYNILFKYTTSEIQNYIF